MGDSLPVHGIAAFASVINDWLQHDDPHFLTFRGTALLSSQIQHWNTKTQLLRMSTFNVIVFDLDRQSSSSRVCLNAAVHRQVWGCRTRERAARTSR